MYWPLIFVLTLVNLLAYALALALVAHGLYSLVMPQVERWIWRHFGGDGDLPGR